MSQSIHRIVIIGPESTGKSTLTRQLAAHFDTKFVDEYARTYLEQLKRDYNMNDLSRMAEGQIKAEDEAAAITRHGLLFCDTDLHVIKVWSESKYGTCEEKILQQIAMRHYALYILTDIDLPWEEDPLREHPEPEMRRYFFRIYKDIVVESGIPFVIAKGNELERLATSITTIKYLISSP